MVRNLAFPASDINLLLEGLGIDVLLHAVEKALDGPSPDLMVQGLGTFKNLSLGNLELRLALLANDALMRGLKECLQHAAIDVRRAASQCVLQLIKTTPLPHHELREFGIDVTLRLMYGSHTASGAVHGTNSQMGFEEDREVRRDVKQALMILDKR